jgi:RHS repeat-associated protein
LVDKETQEVLHYESLNPFGDNLQDLNPISPWIFATKHFDSDIGLIDFGDRQYDPSIKQWTSADPDPRATEEELYSYCNNNPMKFIDPNGSFVIFIPLTQGLWAAAAAILTGIGAFAAKKGVDHINENQKPRRENKNNPRMDNDVKNPQYDDAVKDVERKLGRKLNDKEWGQLHDHVTGQGYGYHEMVDEGFHLFDDRYKHN